MTSTTHEHYDRPPMSRSRPMTARPSNANNRSTARGGAGSTPSLQRGPAAAKARTPAAGTTGNSRATSASRAQDSSRDRPTTGNRPKTASSDKWRQASLAALRQEVATGKDKDKFLVVPTSGGCDDDVDSHHDSAQDVDVDKESSVEQPQKDPVVVEFRVPAKVAAEQFDASLFFTQLQELCGNLQSVLQDQQLDDFRGDRLTQMVSTVSGTIQNFKCFVVSMQELLETARDHMKNVSDFVLRKVMHTMTMEKSYKPVNNAYRGVSLAEIELNAQHMKLTGQLARANESLQRAMTLTLEAEVASNEAQIAAEQAAEHARIAQAEYEERCRVEREIQQAAEDKRRRAEEQAAEAARLRDEQLKALEQRRAELSKPRDDDVTVLAKEWPLWTYETDQRAEFDGGIACLVQADPSIYSQRDELQCSVVDTALVDSSSSARQSMFAEAEELVSNVVHLTLTHNSQTTTNTLQTPIIVTIPYGALVRTNVTREPIAKALFHTSDSTWQPLKSTEITFDIHKGMRFVQAEVTSLPVSLMVVSAMKKDFLRLPRRKDATIESDLDRNFTFRAVKLPRREFFTLQLQPLDADVKPRLNALKGFLASSAIINLSWSSTEFTEHITVTAPVPANPIKLAKLAAARAAKQAKNNKPIVSLDEDVKPARPSGPASGRISARNQQDAEPDDPDKTTVVEEKKQHRWYMGEYGTSEDDENDELSLVKKTPAGRWVVDEDIKPTQPKLDLALFKLHTPINRFLLLRTRRGLSPTTIASFAETIEHLIQHKAVYSIIRQRSDDQCNCVHLLTPLSKLERTLTRLESDGYTVGPDPSKEFFVAEGASFQLSFQNNIRHVDPTISSLPLVFHANIDSFNYFTVGPADRFLQKHFDVYRGVVVVARKSWKIVDKSPKGSDENVAEEVCELETVTTHQISIPKEVESTPRAEYVSGGFSPERQMELTQPPDPLEGICSDERADVLRFVAAELGDEWVVLSRYLQVKPTRLQNIRRHAERVGLDDEQMKLEMLAYWFKTQPRAVDKIEKLRCALTWCGRQDVVDQLPKSSNMTSSTSSSSQRRSQSASNAKRTVSFDTM